MMTEKQKKVLKNLYGMLYGEEIVPGQRRWAEREIERINKEIDYIENFFESDLEEVKLILESGFSLLSNDPVTDEYGDKAIYDLNLFSHYIWKCGRTVFGSIEGGFPSELRIYDHIAITLMVGQGGVFILTKADDKTYTIYKKEKEMRKEYY